MNMNNEEKKEKWNETLGKMKGQKDGVKGGRGGWVQLPYIAARVCATFLFSILLLLFHNSIPRKISGGLIASWICMKEMVLRTVSSGKSLPKNPGNVSVRLASAWIQVINKLPSKIISQITICIKTKHWKAMRFSFRTNSNH